MTAWAVRQRAGGSWSTRAHAYGKTVRRRITDPRRSGRSRCRTTPRVTRPAEFRANADGGDPWRLLPRATGVRLVIFGYLNANRRIVEFLHALATMPERDCFDVHIAGHHAPRARRCGAAVEFLGLRGQVHLSRVRVRTTTLEDVARGEADLAVNLRYPTMGEASGEPAPYLGARAAEPGHLQ